MHLRFDDTRIKVLDIVNNYGKDLYMQSKVFRWNGRLTITSQDIAQHHAIVTQLTILILEEFKVPEKYHLQAIRRAAIHDLPEIFTNDISYVVKKSFPSFAKEYEKVEQEVVDSYHPAFKKAQVEKGSIPWLVTKIADSMDVLLFTNVEAELGSKNEDILGIREDSVARIDSFADALVSELNKERNATC